MLLYNKSLDIRVPTGYRDISDMIAAKMYQYMFVCDQDNYDDFLIIDLMEPKEQIDLHIEEIMDMNEIKQPKLLLVEYSTSQFAKSLNIFANKYKCRGVPREVEWPSDSQPWACVHIIGEIARSDGKPRQVNVLIGISKYQMSDIVISMFREGELALEKKEDFFHMVQTVEVIDPSIFVP
ncbi:hypothetical protein NEHOM01_1602 [Nematocida homosporus]|uniref:uncharacterized protein n=1 Tax=Nematocida homosporus TaxID=1912981 RepID=UPI002220B985|nr:uncharacterized protein NEHOM01_1602 [Nematocida homosporus]KAI5186634.1 hypothetical protein NEHOM01_1602 [Nematocida homosporus]